MKLLSTPVVAPRWPIFASRLPILPLLLALAGLAAATGALAAPHWGDPFSLRQPDGSAVDVLVWGDEYYQRIETPGGFTLIRDPDSGWICYARLDPAGTGLVSTGVPAGSPPPPGLAPGLRLPAATVARLAAEGRRLLSAEVALGPAAAKRAPAPSTLGNVQGITLLIDFSDVPATTPASEFAAYLNQPGYTGYGNNGSVRDYFRDVSDAALDYTNFSPATYYRALRPFTYYDDPNATYGTRARELLREALNALNAAGFDFSQYDANGDGYIDALNVFYAGGPQNGWAVGLWPHSSSIGWSADGVSTYRYQITNIGSAGPRLSTFCHENGHMICFWPDLYDYDHDSHGVGIFCLMSNSGSSVNPVEPCAPLRDLAQWCRTTNLTSLRPALAVTHGVNDVYRVRHPYLSNEYYMIENRQRAGRDAVLPASGLAIWHVDLNGSNNYQDRTPSRHYFCTLVQADGLWEMERNLSGGNATDLWAAPLFTSFNPSTSPAATWWSGAPAPIYVDAISAAGATMTFNYRPELGTMSAMVAVAPAGIPAPWRLEGPAGYLLEGAGERELLLWEEGLYTLTWLPLPHWSAPTPALLTGTLTAGGEPLLFSGTYTDPPFAALATATPAGGRGLSLIDFDGDGDLDIYVCRDDGPNQLLRNDGASGYTDVAAGPLADPGAAMAAAWADYDGDGDLDLYLVRDGQPNRMLRNSGGIFSDVASLGLEVAGPGRAAAWHDFNRDGKLDLYLVQQGAANILFRNLGDLGFGSWTLLPSSAPALEDAGAGHAAPWCDWEGTGFGGPLLVNEGSVTLVRNHGGTMFESTQTLVQGDLGRAAAWGDFDGDGDFDVFVAGAAGSDRLYRFHEGGLEELYSLTTAGDGAGYGVVLADLDNDGHLDVYVAQAGQDRLLFGDGTGAFTPVPTGTAAAGAAARSVACGDLDGDGGLDLVLTIAGEPPTILRNAILDRGHWLHLDLVGTGGNRDAIGARVRLVAGGRSQLRQVQAGGGSLSQDARRVAFGLGTATAADSLLVTWPDGTVELRVNVAGDRVVRLVQGELTAVAEDPGAGGAGAPPRVTSLGAPTPNPFNPTTRLALELAQGGAVEVAVYSLDGRRVAVLQAGTLPAGRHEVTWDGRDAAGRRMASGAYLFRLRTGEGTWGRRVVLVK